MCVCACFFFGSGRQTMKLVQKRSFPREFFPKKTTY